MTENDPKDSVRNEQFGETENNYETAATEQNINSADLDENKLTDENSEVFSKPVKKSKPKKADEAAEISSEEVQSVVEETKADEPKKPKLSTSKKQVSDAESVSEVSDIKEELIETDTNTIESVSELNTDDSVIHPPVLSEIDFADQTKDELVNTLRKFISEYSLDSIKDHVEAIKSVYYKMHNTEIDTIREKFIAEGGKPEDFRLEDSPVDIIMKDLLNMYRDKRNEMSRTQEDQKEINLQSKYNIIESIKELVNSQESLNKTFHDFRNLQENWREIGPVPQKNVKDLWESYHYHVEAFYDYITRNFATWISKKISMPKSHFAKKPKNYYWNLRLLKHSENCRFCMNNGAK
jgi:hypothetical protein